MYQMSCRYPTSLAFNIYGSEKVRHFRDVPCIDNPCLDTGKYSIVTDGTYISAGTINDRIKVAISSLKWTPTLFTLIRVSVNVHVHSWHSRNIRKKFSWIIDLKIIRNATSCLKRNFVCSTYYNGEKLILHVIIKRTRRLLMYFLIHLLSIMDV